MTVVKCRTANQLLDALHHIQGRTLYGGWYFRGQGRNWPLRPSLFREKNITPENRSVFQKATLDELKTYLVQRSRLPRRFTENEDDLLAFAQHYGSPTRTLDFTRSPLVAAYFAASDSLRQSDSDPLVVFAIAHGAGIAQHLHGSEFFTPPAAANPNLAAQNGCLLRFDWKLDDLWRPEYDSHVLNWPDEEPEVGAQTNTRFARFEVPSEQAYKLLKELRLRGVDAVSLFPTEYGFARAAADRAWDSIYPKTARSVGE